jgi:hypothetical protein
MSDNAMLQDQNTLLLSIMFSRNFEA